MKSVFQKLFAKKPAALTGAPPIRRQKTYSAQSGFVYQYFYEGHRSGDVENEYVFSVSADRKNWHPTSVRVSLAALRTWALAHQRELSSTEQYAIAKMALFQAFDERAAPALMKEDVCVGNPDVETFVETLGL